LDLDLLARTLSRSCPKIMVRHHFTPRGTGIRDTSQPFQTVTSSSAGIDAMKALMFSSLSQELLIF